MTASIYTPFYFKRQLLKVVLSIQENMELSGDGYEGDVIGEATPDVLVSEFVCILSFNLYFHNFLSY